MLKFNSFPNQFVPHERSSLIMKSKIKKILVSSQLFFIEMISKVFATSPYEIQTDYGIQYRIEISPIYKWVKVGKVILPVILFIIGLFVILSKKITKKVKAIVISVLFFLVIFGYAFMNYIATN